MSLEPPLICAPTESSSSPISRPTSPLPSFNSILMATTHTSPQSNGTVGVAVPSTIHTPTTPPSADWPRSGSPNPISSDIPGDEAQSLGLGDITDIDPQILEALRSKDRLYVLKLGELMEGLINEHKARIDLTPSTSYQRLLVHRCSAFHKLSPESDPTTKSIIVSLTPESRIPAKRICELVPAELSAQPAFKIMRRTPIDRRSKPHSQAGSVAGDDADLSDVEPSDSGSLGGRSSATGTSKKRMTIEEREAAYNEARSRIFMDFQEKEKEKDMSASSSNKSLVSESASTSEGRRSSSIDDLDESVSTPATESEWSGPVTRDRKDLRYTGSANISGGSSSRSLRSSAPPFNANGTSSSKGSRASSPAFKYASLYEPVPNTSAYDPSQALGGKLPVFTPQYSYGYQPQGQIPQSQQTYLPAYPNYSPYPYPQNVMASGDPASPTRQDPYMPPNQHASQYAPYQNPYVWPHAHQPQPGVMPAQQQHPSQNQHQLSNPAHLSPTQNTPQFSAPYIPQTSPYGPYSMPGYYPPQAGQQMPPPHPQVISQPMYPPDTRVMNGMVASHRNSHDMSVGNHSRTSSRNSAGQGSVNGGGKRGAPPARTAWSYGPGIGMGGFGYGNPPGLAGGAEAVGPRLSSMRRMSQTSSVGSSSAGNRTPAGDEASSTASSSTTSSSSRRTYTSTASSQHPLPARPDWAVGLKPQPTLHSAHPRHHDSSVNSSRGSPARNGAPSLHSPSQPLVPVVLQSTDFPPLTTALPSPPERRAPAVGGAWTNASSTRSIIMPSPGQANPQSSVALNANASNARLEEPDHGFERPPPKSNAELFNPKGSRRSTGSTSNSRHNSLPQDMNNEKAEGDIISNVAGQIASLSVSGDTGTESPSAVKMAPAVSMST